MKKQSQTIPILIEAFSIDLESQDELDLFICNTINFSPKGDLGSMEYPVFTLSTKRKYNVRRYERNGTFIEITPSVLGHATIFDNDILIYCISQLIAGLNAGRQIGRTVRFPAYNFFTNTNRDTGGKEYSLLAQSLVRLRGTTITSNLTTEDPITKEVTKLIGAGLIEDFSIYKKSAKTEEIGTVEITLSKWLYNAVQAKEVLTLDQKYFELRKALERRIYLLVRKHCGNQPNWKISLALLLEKSGSESERREFRRMIKVICDSDTLPGYKMNYVETEDSVLFQNRTNKEAVKTAIKQLALNIK